MFARDKIIVTGLHRSGTTWLGRVIRKTGEVASLHEPFNKAFGMCGVPDWYPYYEQSTQSPENAIVEKLIADLFGGRAQYLWRHPEHSAFKNLVRKLIGSRSEREYRLAVRSKSPRVMLKDPFCLFLSGFLIEKYDARVVVIVRHPAAHLVSMRRMNWVAPLATLLKHRAFREKLAFDFPDRTPEELPEIDVNSYFWLAAHRYILSLRESFPDRVLVCRHEDISREPVPNILSICSFLNIDGPGPAVDYAAESTSGSVVRPADRQLHSFSRDGQALTNYWRRVLSRTEVDHVRDIVAPISHEFYDESDWFVG